MTLLCRTALSLVWLVLFAAVALAQEDLPTNVQVGSPLPDVMGVDLIGDVTDLNAVIGEKTVVFAFWSIYCSDCIRELDDLRSIRAEFPIEEVEVVAVNTDSAFPVSRIVNFLRRYEGVRGQALNVKHILDRDNKIVEQLGIRYIPLMVTVDSTGNVSSILSGYNHREDRSRLYQAMEQGRVALGAWSEGPKAKLRALLRGAGPDGLPLEWGSFHVEEGMALFGWYDTAGWSLDVTGKARRVSEVQRVETIVGDRLKIKLMNTALSSVGIRLPREGLTPYQIKGITIPESPMVSENRWFRLYQALSFSELYKTDQETALWVDDEYWAGLVGDVDLGRLRVQLKDMGFPYEPNYIKLATVSDYEFKPRLILKALKQYSYRVHSFQGDTILYFGTLEQLVDELERVRLPGMEFYVDEIGEMGGAGLRIEIF